MDPAYGRRCNNGVPGISPPPVILAPRGQITRDLTLPARPPLGISLPPSRHSSENILVFRPSYQESFWYMVWQFIWQRICASQTQSQCCLTFSKSWSWLPSQQIRDYSFAAASLILLSFLYCQHYRLSHGWYQSQTNTYSLSCQTFSCSKHIFTFFKSHLKITLKSFWR